MGVDELMLLQLDGRMFHHCCAADLSIERVVFSLCLTDIGFQRQQLIQGIL